MIKKLMAVILALVMLTAVAAAAAEAPADWMQDVKTGMSKDALKALLGEPLSEYSVTDNTYEMDYEMSFAGVEGVYVGFIFSGDSLAMVGIYNINGLNSAEGLATLKQAMTAEYGEPADVSSETIARIFAILSGIEMGTERFANGSEWQADDSTLVWVFSFMRSDDDQASYVVYVSREILNGDGTPSDQPEETETPTETETPPETETPDAGEDDPALQGTWILTDLRATDEAGEEEIGEMLEMIRAGELTQTYTFRDGIITATMIVPSYGLDQTITASYRISGNTIIVKEDGEEEESDPVEYRIDGDTMELVSDEDLIMIFTRQE